MFKYPHPLFIFVGGSGVGKSTQIALLLVAIDALRFVRAHTSRERRVSKGESPDAYFFVRLSQLKALIADDLMLEWDQPFLKAEVPNDTTYGRSKESFRLLEEHPGVADMTEKGVLAVLAAHLAPTFVIKIIATNKTDQPHANERAHADAARDLTEIPIHLLVKNDHADPEGKQKTHAQILEFVLSRLTVSTTPV